MGIATGALIIYIALIIVWSALLRRSIGEAMILGFVVVALFGGQEMLSLMWQGLVFGITHEVLFAAMAFVFMAYIIEQTGLILKLIEILNSLLGRLPGGAAYVDTIASAIFGAISGSGSGNTATVGAITIPWMLRTGWSKERAATIAAGNAGLGISVPPSGSMFILLGMASISAVVTEGQLFISLYVAGFFTLIYRLMLITFFVRQQKVKGISVENIKPLSIALRDGWTSLLIFLGILIPVLITIGPFSDYLKSEVVSAASLKAISILTWVPISIIIISLIISWKSLPKKPKDIKHFFKKLIPSYSVIGVILLFAFAASDVLKNLGLSQELGTFMESLDLSVWMMAALVGILIILIATPLTATATVTAVGGVAFSALVSVGIDPVVALVAILVFASTEGASPPGGAPIFIAAGIADENPVKTFIPLIIYYVIPVAFIGWLIAVGLLPVPGL